MKYLFCDVCKQQFSEPFNRDRDIFFLHEYDICETCRDDLEKAIKYTVREKAPFNYVWYKNMILEVLKKGCEKGRIVVS
jgi:hypothetical protein